VAGSSDAPIEPADPWTGLAAAIDYAGLSPEEAVTMYTESAGAALGEDRLGTLEPGSSADLLVVGASTVEEAIRLGGPVDSVYRDGHLVAGLGSGKGAI
jgi:predicted amidohydrolase YtcJ